MGRTYSEPAARAGPRYTINGRALQREQYKERLAQQQARGGPWVDQAGGAAGHNAPDADHPVCAAGAPLVGRDAGHPVGGAGGWPRGVGRRREVNRSVARPLPTLVDGLVYDPRRGALRFQTLFAVSRGLKR